MPDLAVVGVDPGITCGLVVLRWRIRPGSLPPHDLHWPPDAVRAYQCDHNSAPELLDWVLEGLGGCYVLGAIEEFVEGVRSVRTRNPQDAKITRALVPVLTLTAAKWGVTLHARPATMVKTWAERNKGERMEASGVYAKVPKKMVDARSAGGQALFAAVKSGRLPDPLSSKAKG